MSNSVVGSVTPKPPIIASTTPNTAKQATPAVVEVYSDESIVAKPLVDPDFTNLKPRNPNISLRWVNRVAGSGARYEQMKAKGFANATPADVVVPAHMLKDGSIINGDLILMKISRRDYIGGLKYKDEKAVKLVNPRATSRAKLGEALGEVVGSPEQKSKITTFTPTTEDLEAGSIDKS